MLGNLRGPLIFIILIAGTFFSTANAFLLPSTVAQNPRALFLKNVFGKPVRPRISLSGQPASDDAGEGVANKGIEAEIGRLQEQLSLIEALEARNEAQLDSFIDAEDQWNSMEEEERSLLESKEGIIEKMELLAEEMMMLWMGQKSQNG